MRSTNEFNMVQRLIASGMNDCAIARQTRIPRSTIRGWRHNPSHRRRAGEPHIHDFATLPAVVYCYLLGLYLGDGCISRQPRTWHLRITLDSKYPEIIKRCRQAIDILMPGQCAGALRRPDNCTDVYLYSEHWPCLFPQHGPGKKHHRPIRLKPWQEDLVNQATEEFIRGLIDSDGCRVVANDRGVPRRYRQGVSTTRRRRPALIVLVIVAACACLALGWWQWTRFQEINGNFQNLGYALQWPLFAWFCVYAYRKFVRYEEAPPEPHRPDTVTEIPAGLLPERPGPAATPTDDAALRDYNAYLAELTENDRKNRNTA